MRKLKFACAAVISLAGIAVGATPAAACGYSGCGGEVVVVQPQPYVVVQPQPYVAQSCSCCGCGTTYGAYAPAYVAPPYYFGGSYYRPYYAGYIGAQWGPRFIGGYGYRRWWLR